MFASFTAIVLLVLASTSVAAPMPNPGPEAELVKRSGLATVYSKCTKVSCHVAQTRSIRYFRPNRSSISRPIQYVSDTTFILAPNRTVFIALQIALTFHDGPYIYETRAYGTSLILIDGG